MKNSLVNWGALAFENKGKTTKLKSIKPSDLELIKTTANGKYKNVYARIYKNSTGSVTCKLSERKKVKGVFKRRKLKIGDLIDESFKGSCVLRVYQVYVGTSKTITLSAEEIMATELKLRGHTLMNMRKWLAMSHRRKKQIKMPPLITF